MAYTPIMNAFRLTGEEAGGQPSYMDALMKGFQGAQSAYETAIKPQSLSEALLQAQLKNAHDRIINQYLPRSEEARIGATESNTALDPFRQAQMEAATQSTVAETGMLPWKQRLIEAQINSANRGPAAQYNPLEKAMAGYDRAVQQYGEGSLQAAQAKIYAQRIAEGSRGPQSASTLTNAMKTQMQNIVSGVPKVSKKIDSLIEAPSPVTILGYKSDQKAAHNSLVKETAETYAKAKGWPNTNESIKAAIDILDRHTFESDDAYHKRLRDLKKSLSNDLQDAHKILNPNAPITESASITEKDPLGLGL